MHEVIERYDKFIMRPIREPIIIEKGRGIVLEDVNGRQYLDFTSGQAVMALGYQNPSVLEGIKEQLSKLEHCTYCSHAQAELAEILARIAPGKLKKTFFCNSGTEAVEGAIRLARKYTKKFELISLYGSFHGRSMGAVSLTGHVKEKRGMGPYLPGVMFVPAPYCYRCSLGLEYPNCGIACAKFIDNALTFASSGSIAAIVIEPILAHGGIIIPPEEYLSEIRRVCNQHESLLVVDEVQTGFGRTGKMFAVEHWGIEPDIMILGKPLGGGLPLGAFMATDNLAHVFEWTVFSSTTGGNPLACAAGLSMIQTIQREEVIENAVKMGEFFIKNLQELKERHELIGDVRGKGLIIGVELVRDRKIPATSEIHTVREKMKNLGILIALCGESTIRIIPPLNIAEEHVTRFIKALDQVLREIGR